MDTKTVAFPGLDGTKVTATRNSRWERFQTEDGIFIDPFLLSGAEPLEYFPPLTLAEKATSAICMWTEGEDTYLCADTGSGWVSFLVPKEGVPLEELGARVDTFRSLVLE